MFLLNALDLANILATAGHSVVILDYICMYVNANMKFVFLIGKLIVVIRLVCVWLNFDKFERYHCLKFSEYSEAHLCHL